MPAFSQRQIIAAQWRENIFAEIKDTCDQMVEPFSLENLYPELERMENGHYETYRMVQEHQRKFHEKITPSGKKANFIAISGGYGSGKSITSVVDLIYMMRVYPGIIFYVTAGFDWYFDDIFLPNLRKVISDDVNECPLWKRINIRTRTYEMINGSRMVLRVFDDPSKCKGFECHCFLIEEASMLGAGNNSKAIELYKAMLGRMRAPGNYPNVILANQNPAGHNWLWKLCLSKSAYKDRMIQNWITRPGEDPDRPEGRWYYEAEYESGNIVFYWIEVPTFANTALPPSYVDNMKANYDEQYYKTMVEGSSNPLHEIVFAEPRFSQTENVITWEQFLRRWELDWSDEKDIPYYWRRIVGIDTAASSSGIWGVLFFVETPDRDELICYDEIYGSFSDWYEVIERIKEKTDGLDDVEYWADPHSGPQKIGVTSTSAEEEFRHYGLQLRFPKGYSRHGGVAHVVSLFKRDKNVPSAYHEDDTVLENGEYRYGKARLYYIAGRAPNAIREKEVWRFDRKPFREKELDEGVRPELGEKFIDKYDHTIQAECYACMGWFPIREDKHANTMRRVASNQAQTRYTPMVITTNSRKATRWKRY